MRKIIGAAVLLFAGFMLPNLLFFLSDRQYEAPVRAPIDENAAYVYRGTFENRVSALSAYLNEAPGIQLVSCSAYEPAPTLSVDIDGLTPELGEGTLAMRAFTLSSVSVGAEFWYREYRFTGERGLMSVVIDAETGKALSISVSGAREALMEWENSYVTGLEGYYSAASVEAHELARAFAASQGYYDITDLTDGNARGAGAVTAEADIKGTVLGVKVTFSAQAGVLRYRMLLSGNSFS